MDANPLDRKHALGGFGWPQMLVVFANAAFIAFLACVFDREATHRDSFWRVLLIASLLCAADLQRTVQTQRADQLPTDFAARWACLTTAFSVLATWITAILFSGKPTTSFIAIGFCLAINGAVIRALAVTQLGENFVSDIRPFETSQQAFRTSRIYRFVRHPSELGLLLLTLSACLVSGSWVSFLIWVTCILSLSLLRVRTEETHMMAIWGEAYAEYRSRVGALLPRW